VTPLTFLRQPEVQRLLDLVRQTAALPLSIHAHQRGEEGLRAEGWGGCAVCSHVAGLPGGRSACRASREVAGSRAMAQQRPIAFVCHAGLSCLSFPVVSDLPLVATLGPYIPDEDSGSIEVDVATALQRFDTGDGGEAPPLDDVRRLPPAAPLAAATLLRDSLAVLWREAQGVEVVEAPAQTLPLSRRAARSTPAPKAGFAAEEAALLLAGGNRAHVRAMLLEALEQAAPTPGRKEISAGPRALALAAAIVDAAGRAGVDASRASSALAESAALLQSAASPKESVRIVMQALRSLHTLSSGSTPMARYAALDAALAGRVHQRVTLNEIARELGETPSAITHRLQRKFGVSFSEYVGRLRVEEAKRMLRKTKLSATEIGRKVGIGDQSYFTKVFKRHEGMTPLAYRARFGR
jgi:AraC-like DNA-binding protein